MKFTKRDLVSSVVTGLITGVILWRILSFLGAPTFGLWHPHSYFVIIVPILWILGVNLGYFLGRWMPFFSQFGRFVAVGFTNAAVDFGVLNLQIALTGHTAGVYYAVFKTVSFVVAVIHSYAWNKYWVFEAAESGGGQSELLRFLGVNVVAIIVNVGIASVVVNFIPPFGGVGPKVWANIGAVVGSACAIVFNFVGSRFLVFKKNDGSLSQI